MGSISLVDARRVAIKSQLLEGPRPVSSPEAVLDVARRLRCIQIDPINVVARTQLLVLWSRLSEPDPAHLDRLIWERKDLFHYWAHAASLVLTSDFPLHKMRMQRYARDPGLLGERHKRWMEENAPLRRKILDQLRRRGPLRSRDLGSMPAAAWESTGWTAGQTVTRMLDFMWTRGEIMIAGRDGLQRIWDLSERWFPDRAQSRPLPKQQGYDLAVGLAFSCLGVATPTQVNAHFVRGEHPDLKGAIARLERKKVIHPVEITDGSHALRGKWFIHSDALPLLEEVVSGRWDPRTILLSPFDNLIADRKRTLMLFDLDYKIEIYVPKAKRRYGYYALPILHGDRLVGTIDCSVDRKAKVFNVLNVHAQAGAPKEAGAGIARAVGDLARFTGSSSVGWTRDLPRGWARALRSVTTPGG